MMFKKCKTYFLDNRDHFDHLDWELPARLTEAEREIIRSSIQQFQRGEYSEGKHFLRYAHTIPDSDYVDTIKVFIREEQDHAMVLGRYLDKAGIEKIADHGLDNIFRFLRKMWGLELTVTVLLSAEIIAMVYYKALHAATSCNLLRQICNQVLKDETMHLRFQSDTLRYFYAHKSPWMLVIMRSFHWTLMMGTICMVWLFHRRVLRAGGFSFLRYFADVWREFIACEKQILAQDSIEYIWESKTKKIKSIV